MYLIVGLGNYTEPYLKNRHNVGFLALDYMLSKKEHRSMTKSLFKGALYKVQFSGFDALMLKPHTFMNLSGESLHKVAGFYKIAPENIIVVYDDLDIVFGGLKFKIGGRDGGHNGIKSINGYTPNSYKKIKIGIGRPMDKTPIEKYVLSDFSTMQTEHLETTIFPKVYEAISQIDTLSYENISSRYSVKNGTL